MNVLFVFCMCSTCMPGAGSQKRALDPLKVELEIIVSHSVAMWALGKEPMTYRRPGFLTTKPSQQPVRSSTSSFLLSSILLQDHLTVTLSVLSTEWISP